MPATGLAVSSTIGSESVSVSVGGFMAVPPADGAPTLNA
jgi:hypothetical protein